MSFITEKVKTMMNDDYIFIHGNNISMVKLLVRQLSHTACEFYYKKSENFNE